jgi:hypothetical protein
VSDAVDADVRVVCRLTRMGAGGLALEVGVRPFPQGRLHPPGEGAAVVFAARAETRLGARRDLEAEVREARGLVESLPPSEATRVGAWSATSAC